MAGSYTILATYLEEVDEASGYYEDGVTPKKTIWRTQGEVFTPQSETRCDEWEAAEAIEPEDGNGGGSGNIVITAIAPNNASANDAIVITGTGFTDAIAIDFISQVETGVKAVQSATPTSDTELDTYVPGPLMAQTPGAYTVQVRSSTDTSNAFAFTLNEMPA